MDVNLCEKLKLLQLQRNRSHAYKIVYGDDARKTGGLGQVLTVSIASKNSALPGPLVPSSWGDLEIRLCRLSGVS